MQRNRARGREGKTGVGEEVEEGEDVDAEVEDVDVGGVDVEEGGGGAGSDIFVVSLE